MSELLVVWIPNFVALIEKIFFYFLSTKDFSYYLKYFDTRNRVSYYRSRE